MLFGIFGELSEYERAMIQERTMERLAAKKRRGERVGRKPALTPSQIALAKRELESGTSAKVVARNLRVGRSTLSRPVRRVAWRPWDHRPYLRITAARGWVRAVHVA